MRRLALLPLTLLAAGAIPGPATAAAQRPAAALQRIGRFSEPVYVTAPRGDANRLFVVERYGRIRIVRGGRTLHRPFLDLGPYLLLTSHDETVDQRGLLSMAFAPDYAKSGRFYVFFIDRRDRIRVDEFRRSARDPDHALRSSDRPLLALGNATTQHHGGQLQFGPDGMLYVSTGIGDTPATAQDLSTLGGKILRIDPRLGPGGAPYTIPAGNPFAATAGARPEIWAYGLRNPWRFSFDGPTRSLLIGDVGDAAVEEVDLLAPDRGGANFGWNIFEGSRRNAVGTPAGYVAPALEKTHASGWCAVVGGYVVRDRSLPALYGRYVYGDVCSGHVRSARLAGGRLVGDRSAGIDATYLVSFGEDGLSRPYAVGLSGDVWRLRPPARRR